MARDVESAEEISRGSTRLHEEGRHPVNTMDRMRNGNEVRRRVISGLGWIGLVNAAGPRAVHPSDRWNEGAL